MSDFSSFTLAVENAFAAQSPDSRPGAIAVIGSASNWASDAVSLANGDTNRDTLCGRGYLRDFFDTFYTELNRPSFAMLACPIEGNQAGSSGSVTHVGTGVNTPTVGGTTEYYCRPKVKITLGGALGVGKAAVSLDDGAHYNDEATVAETGIIAIADTGLTLTLSGTLVADDTFAWKMDPNDAAVAKVTSAMDSLRTYCYNNNLLQPSIYVVTDPMSASDWATLQTKADLLLGYKAPCQIVAPFRRRDEITGETASAYRAAHVTAVSGLSSAKRWIAPVAGYHTMLRYSDDESGGWNLPTSVLGLLLARTMLLEKISDSAGHVRQAKISTEIVELDDAMDATDEQQTLHDLGFSLLRVWDLAAGNFAERMKTLAGGTSKYRFFDRNRVVFYAADWAVAVLFPEVGGDLSESTLPGRKALINNKLNSKIVKTGLAQAAWCNASFDDDTETLSATVGVQWNTKATAIEVSVGAYADVPDDV